ncbi:hypothetical protein GCM10010971_07770 [Silvimonas amylolytica]|uniref:Uncharacterized protein n=1 Tax=Silvimonas amylolytica TaxID=449663 RepID=A0ABQ2PH73_9NEIS|nr:hypothetical protein GCM10010971_07770 [Silvimonas amylolytica]
MEPLPGASRLLAWGYSGGDPTVVVFVETDAVSYEINHNSCSDQPYLRQF